MLRLLLIFLLIPFVAPAQSGAAIAAAAGSSKYSIDYQKHKGYIILNSGKKVNGIFEYATWEFPSFNLKHYDENGNLITRYKMAQINKAVFYGADTSLIHCDSTYFKRLNDKSYLSRQLTNGRIKVYDDLFNINERPGLIKTTQLTVYFQDKVYKVDSEKKFIELIQKISPSIMISHDASIKSVIKQLNSAQ
ncbi:MAG: hypothetical protein KGL19_13015 [Bacteroidota bacterium]|nr:hypothetical protein [Bacteroidota bacterium]